MKFVKREQWGAPAGSPAAYIGSTRGVKVHYLGSPYGRRAHSGCDDAVRAIRSEHLNHPTEDYVDIAYNALVCEHGYVFEGRGAHRKTGANGNSTLNAQHYAVCALLGSSGFTEPTDAMLGGIRDAIEWLRSAGDAGNEIKGHRDGFPTACPGDPLYAWVRKGAPRPKETQLPFTKRGIAKAVWETDNVVYVPWGTEKNPARKPESIIVNTLRKVDEMEDEIAELKKMLRAISAKLGI